MNLTICEVLPYAACPGQSGKGLGAVAAGGVEHGVDELELRDVFLNRGLGKGRGTFTDSTGCDAVSIPEPIKVKLGRRGCMEYTIGTSIKCGMGGAARYKHTFRGHGNCRRCDSHVSGLSWPWFECSCCGCNGYCMVCLEKYGTVYEKADCARDE